MNRIIPDIALPPKGLPSKGLSARLMLAAMVGGAMLASPALAREHGTGEEQLATLLKGRVAGKPVDCISLPLTSNTTIIDKTAIVYQSAGTYYVNRPHYADSLDDDDILVTKTWGTQLCRLDLVRLHDRSAGFFHGAVSLEQFVPYTLPSKVKPASATTPAKP